GSSLGDQARQAKARDLEDLGERGFHFLSFGVPEASLERREDLPLVMAADRDDEREAELLAVRRVPPAEPLVFFVVETVQARARLLGCRRARERARPSRPAGQVGMGAQERQLLLPRGPAHDGHHRGVERLDAYEWA